VWAPEILFKIILSTIGVISIFYGITYMILSFLNIMKMNKKLMRFMGSILVGVSISVFIIAFAVL
jgi:hypothetical protein